jgi:predicted amidohydrolase
MNNLKVAVAQFEHRSADKDYNLSVIHGLSAQAAEQGARVIAFHECSITGYSFARSLSKSEMLALAEYIPCGKSVERLTAIARDWTLLFLTVFLRRKRTTNYTKLMYV